jgi:hypothetical protein
MNMDLKDNTEKYNKLNGIIRRHFRKKTWDQRYK